ncbi:hypothetical protein BpHYR1_002564 [Brachionus plicatilis]|uniref:Uncharacterized protein n=1 Tax=Brachionus plicatilis TaxID=10195 RepID=A0A3M7RGE6_BRAPC|nr:hypothetical protein BpHYR1_002564 [Brachionus plicatilis]
MDCLNVSTYVDLPFPACLLKSARTLLLSMSELRTIGFTMFLANDEAISECSERGKACFIVSDDTFNLKILLIIIFKNNQRTDKKQMFKSFAKIDELTFSQIRSGSLLFENYKIELHHCLEAEHYENEHKLIKQFQLGPSADCTQLNWAFLCVSNSQSLNGSVFG